MASLSLFAQYLVNFLLVIGLGTVGFTVDPYAVMEAEDMTFNMGTTVVALGCPNNRSPYVSDINPDDYIAFYGVDFGATGPELVEIRFSDGNGFGHFGKTEIRLGSMTGQLIATIDTGVTGDWCNYMTLPTFLSYIPTGIQNVYILFDSQSRSDEIFHLDWLVFNASVTLVQ